MKKRFLLFVFMLLYGMGAMAHSGGVWIANDGCGHWYAIVFHWHTGSQFSVASGNAGLYIDFDQNGFFDIDGVQYAYTNASGFPTSRGEFSRFTDWMDLTNKTVTGHAYANDAAIQTEVLNWLNANKSFGRNYELTVAISSGSSSTWFEALVCEIQPLSPGQYKASTSTSSQVETPSGYTNPFNLNYQPATFAPIDAMQSVAGNTLDLHTMLTATCVSEFGYVYSYTDSLPAVGGSGIQKEVLWSGSATDYTNMMVMYTINASAGTETKPYYVRAYYKQQVGENVFYVYSALKRQVPLDPTKDADGDGITNGQETSQADLDTDDDGTPDFKDLDSDGDGATDATEGAAADCDGDAVPDYRDLSLLPVINTESSDQIVCDGLDGKFKIVATVAGIGYQWQEDDGTGFKDLADGAGYAGTATNELTVSAVQMAQSGYTYRCVVSSSTCGTSNNSQVYKLTVQAFPNAPTVTNPSFVQGDSPTPLSGFVTGPNLMWYADENGGVGSSTPPTFSTNNVDTLTFWVAQTVNGCESPRAKIEVYIVEPLKIAGTATKLGAFYPLSTVVDPGIELKDGAGTLDAATVSIIEGFQSGDVLTYKGTLPSGVTANYNATTGELKFTGDAAVAAYQALLRNVLFYTTSANRGDRKISFSISNVVSLIIEGKPHFYTFVSKRLTWKQAKADATSRKFYGMTGYLATVESSEENAFIQSKLQNNGWISATDDFEELNAVLADDFANQAAAEGKFYWVTGPNAGTLISTGNRTPVTAEGGFANWAAGEPNDSGPEHYTQFYYSQGGKWNDLPASFSLPGYLVEFGGFPDDLTPQSSHVRTISFEAGGLELSNRKIMEQNDLGETVGTFVLTGGQDGFTYTYQFETGEGDSDNGLFGIAEDTLQATSLLIKNEADQRSILVKVSDEFGGSYVSQFLIDILERPKEIVGSSEPVTAFFPLSFVVDPNVEIIGRGTLAEVSVYMEEGKQVGDTLFVAAADLPNGVTTTFDKNAGQLTIKGELSVANYQALLRKVRFHTSSADHSDRKVSFSISNFVSLIIEGKPHFYTFVSNRLNWKQAKADATTRTFQGMTGYLATVESAEENAFIQDKLQNNGWISATDDFEELNAVLADDFADQAASEGIFYWVTGPNAGTLISTGNRTPVTAEGGFANWAAGEPNNAGSEHYTQFFSSQGGKWNDLPASSSLPGYLVEFGGFPDDPTAKVIHTRTLKAGNASIVLNDNTVDENQPSNAQVGSLSVTGGPEGLTYTYQMAPGTGDTNNADFGTGTAALLTAKAFNFEAKATYLARISAHDQFGGSFSQAFEVLINDVNDAPTAAALSNSSVAENLAAGAAVGNLSATDEDAGDTHTFEILEGGDAASFTLEGAQLKTAAAFNFEAKASYSLTVRATDSKGATFDQVLTVTVTDANDTPTNIALSNNQVNENEAVGTVVGDLTSTDEDAEESHTYSINAGADAAAFTIDGAQLKTAAAFNFEAKASYTISIRTTDKGSATFDKDFTVTVKDVNEVPTDMALSANSIFENRAANTVIGNLSATDVDADESFTYALVGTGNDNAQFNLNGNVLRSSASFDFETKNTYAIRVQVTDKGGLTFEKNFTINVGDVNDAPFFATIGNTAIRVSDYPKTLNITGIRAGFGAETSQQLTFTATSDDPNLLLNPTIQYTNGTATAVLTYVAKPQTQSGSVEVTVTLRDNGGTANGGVDTYSQVFTINVEEPNGTVFVPNTFTPNGDGNNDFFRVRGEDIQRIKFSVFDALGNQVYSTSNVEEATRGGWDGRIGGNLAPLGTYSWMIEGQFADGRTIEFNGKKIGVVTLIR